MKKLIAIFLVVIIGFSANAQDSIKVAVSDTSQVTYNKVYNDVKAGLTGLAAGLKVTATHVYEVLVKQQVVNAIIGLISVILLSIITIVLWIKFNINIKRTETDGDKWYRDDLDDHFGLIGLMIIAIIFTVVTLIIFGVNINSIITGFCNPEYGAIKDISNFIH